MRRADRTRTDAIPFFPGSRRYVTAPRRGEQVRMDLMRMTRAVRSFAALAPLVVLGAFFSVSPPLAAGETDMQQAQPYEKIRYPAFKDGRLESILEADQAEAYDLAEGTPRVNLRNVSITLYDLSEAGLKDLTDDQPPPVRMTITSDRGFFTRRPPEPGAAPEEVANLEGNVVLRQMRSAAAQRKPSLKPTRLDPSIEAEIHCQHAQWNNTLRKLNGDGEVEFLQEDSRIVGTGFLYLADDEAVGNDRSANNIKDWGGIVFIEHNARMEIDRYDVSGATGRTEITCKDTASYKLREREIQFENEVRIRRPGLTIEADILKVFLRREEEMREGSAPGQVKNIVATIGKRSRSVVISGYDAGKGDGNETLQYVARGGRADYDFDTNRITLTDSRTDIVPKVEFGDDLISDRTLDFVFFTPKKGEENAAAGTEQGKSTLETLNASGGRGEVRFRSRSGGTGQNAPIDISYKGEMNYSRAEGRIRFQEAVFLKQGDMRIRAEIVEARLNPGAENIAGPGAINRILAENDVNIQAAGREARAQRAEYEFNAIGDAAAAGQAANLYTLRLFGPPQKTPPHPWIRDEAGNQISAPEIHMQRLESVRNSPDGERHLIHATGGVAVCDFYAAPRNITEPGKTISIKCEKGMEYNEATGVAWFEGQVMATSDAPEDNYVLTCNRLVINLPEMDDPKRPGERVVRIRRIDADGNARLMQDVRICEANRIIRDFPSERLDEGDIYLEGAPARDGRPPQMAVYREQIGSEVGSMFAAPRIMAAAKGDLIRANGPGQLSIPDEIPGQRSEIHFEGAALYESAHQGRVSSAKFRRNVRMTQPSNRLSVSSEELDAAFLRDDADFLDADRGEIAVERIGKLQRIEIRVGVKIEHASPPPKQGTRVAVGDKGVVEFHPNGNVITLSADRRQDSRRFVMARDYDGLTLRAPDIEIREGQGVTRASGPGDLQVPGNAGGGGLASVPTRVLYGERGQMVYNELAMNIRVADNVRVIQPGAGNNWSFPSLDGRCDRMDITLAEPPAAGMSGEEALARVTRMDTVGGVLLRVYADPPPENPNIDWLSRPGTTFFVRGDQGTYFVPEGRIEISALPGRRPQLLLNMVDSGSPPRRQRMRAERFILNTNTMPRRWTFDGQLDSNTLREGEAFEFID